MIKNKLGIIGTGVMGQAIISRAVNNRFLQPEQIGLYDLDQEKAKSIGNNYSVYSSAQDLVDASEYVLLSIKPQHFDDLSGGLTLHEYNNVISIMAGVKTETIQTKLLGANAIARIMPNTPCQIGYGTCAVCFSGKEESIKKFVIDLFSNCGKVYEIEERFFDAVTSVSGSGPAYVYMFLQGMIQGGINGGLTPEESKALAIGTAIGAAKLAENSSLDLSTLTERVCSKGGTTIEAVNLYKNKRLIEIVSEGVDACRNRSEELSRK